MGYFGCNVMRFSAVVLALLATGMGIFCLTSPNWLTQNLKLSKKNFEKGTVDYGLISSCHYLPAQPRTGGITYSNCAKYGKDIGKDWPSGCWAAAVVLQGVAVIFSLTVVFAGLADMCLIRSTDIFCSLSMGFGSLVYAATMLTFLAGIGGDLGIDGVGMLEVCTNGGPFNLGDDCELKYVFYLTILACFCSIVSTGLFALSGKKASGSGAYA
eukprot:comp12896_c0_seq1/m.8092 comp12896_c0_seq1/g.8092  ORF comp12896_c0_seq1/g.8092 comp12896_c0_seq1/m.8092 type:complete len:213 (-) comp12896_c0_seq1:429-1067(-)